MEDIVLKMLETITSYIFFAGLLSCVVLIIPVLTVVITDSFASKNITELLSINGYDELSYKMKEVKKYKGGNALFSKEWNDVQLYSREFRHFKFTGENKKLKLLQSLNKLCYILTIIFIFFILTGFWGMSFSFILATIRAVFEHENLRVKIIMTLFSIILTGTTALFSYSLMKHIKYY